MSYILDDEVPTKQASPGPKKKQPTWAGKSQPPQRAGGEKEPAFDLFEFAEQQMQEQGRSSEG